MPGKQLSEAEWSIVYLVSSRLNYMKGIIQQTLTYEQKINYPNNFMYRQS